MLKEKRYQVATWSSDVGADDKMDFGSKKEAEKEARKYKGIEEYACIFDRRTCSAFVIFGNPFSPVFRDYVKVFYKDHGKIKRAF